MIPLVFRFPNMSSTKSFNVNKSKLPTNPREKFPLKCSNESGANTCKINYFQSFDSQEPSDSVYPDYFRWIHEDLRPWKSTGISRETLEKGRNSSNFRLAIINGRAYLEKFKPSFQTRDLFTVWGIVQLLRLYPDKVPNLELMLECGDVPLIKKGEYQGANRTSLWPPPALFQYCGSDYALNVVFPDWTFWGWTEVNIGPWEKTLKGIIKGSKKMKWKKREPYAFWKGNPRVSPNRLDLLKCNLSAQIDWGARLYAQAHKIGKRGSKFIKENLKMENVYAYMLYLLKEYAKLQTFKPEVPKGAEEVCSESMVCSLDGEKRNLLEESMIISPADKLPCVMSPPFDPHAFQSFEKTKDNITRRVAEMENGYWAPNNDTKKYLSSPKFIET